MSPDAHPGTLLAFSVGTALKCDFYDVLVEPLTERETAVMTFLCKGMKRSEIAVVLEVSENTVKHHMRNIYSKYGVGTRADAVEFHMARVSA